MLDQRGRCDFQKEDTLAVPPHPSPFANRLLDGVIQWLCCLTTGEMASVKNRPCCLEPYRANQHWMS